MEEENELPLFSSSERVGNDDEYDIITCCSICFEELTIENKYVLESCHHEFHSNCLIQWFRSGKNTCPVCRDQGTTNTQNDMYHHVYFSSITSRILFKMKTNFALHNKHAPKEFTKIVKTFLKTKEKVKKQEQKYKVLKDEQKNMKKLEKTLTYYQYQEMRKKITKKKVASFNQLRKLRFLLQDLEKTIDVVPIKPLVITKRKINRRKNAISRANGSRDENS